MSRNALFIIFTTFISIIVLTFLLGIGYCIYSLKKGPRRFTDNNISHFKNLLPKYKLRIDN
jgi:hypothetical protein